MSSVTPSPPPTVVLGDDFVNATALDGVIREIVAKLNAVIAVMGVIRQGRGRFTDKSVRMRALSAECLEQIREHVQLLTDLRRQFSTNYDPNAKVQSQPGAVLSAVDGQPFFEQPSEQLPGPFEPSVSLAGKQGATYKLSFRLRSLLPVSNVAPGIGANPENRIVVGSQPYIPNESSPIVGVEMDDLYVVINAVSFIPTHFVIDTELLGAGGTPSGQFQLPLVATGEFNFRVDWGDGSSHTITAWDQPETLHTYPAPGVYTIFITGLCRGFRFNNGGDRRKLIDIIQWGNSVSTRRIMDGQGANFYGAVNLPLVTAADTPEFAASSTGLQFLRGAATFDMNVGGWDMSQCLDLASFFNGCSVFTNGGSDSIRNWSVGNSDNMSFVFQFASLFNHPLDGWDMRKCRFISGMFHSALAFNQPLSMWQLDALTESNGTFQSAVAFNQNLGSWAMSQVVTAAGMFREASVFDNLGSDDIGGWDVSACLNFSAMFLDAIAFNRDIAAWDTSAALDMSQMFAGSPGSGMIFNRDIGGWDVSNVLYLSAMFDYNTAFNQDIGGWDTSACIDMTNMFRGATAFNQDISAWNVDNCRTFQQMFLDASAFKQNLGNWWPVYPTVNLTSMFGNIDMNSPASPSNLITFVSQFENSAWTKTNLSIGANGSSDPSGTTQADKLRPNTTNTSDHSIRQTRDPGAGGLTMEFSVYLLAAEYTFARVSMDGQATASVDVDLSTGAITGGAGTVTAVGGGWYKVSVQGVTGAAGDVNCRIRVGTTALFPSFVGNNSNGIFAWNARLYDTAMAGNTANYEALLVGWTGWAAGAPGAKGLALGTGRSFGAGNARLTVGSDAAAARTWLINVKGWTITDGGFV